MVRRKPDNPKRTNEKKRKSIIRKSNIMVGTKEYKISVKLLREITRMQNSIRNLIPKLPFARLVREIIQGVGGMDYKIQMLALAALQESAEVYLVHFFEDANLASAHAGRITVMPRDMQLVKKMRANDL